MDRRFYFKEIERLLSKMTVERVWPDLDRRSRNERLTKGWAYSVCRNRTKRRAAMAETEHLAGVLPGGDSELDFFNE